jgi:hypothetical protein
MANIYIDGSSGVTNALQNLLMCDDLNAGTEASYQMCKTIYEWHPYGLKMAQKPLRIAMSQARDISIQASPGELVKEAFIREWNAMDVDGHILNVATLARIYGIASCAYGAPNVAVDKDIDPKDLSKLKIYFNDLDPLNTAGSLVLNQDPNSPDFQKHASISVAGVPYARSRSVTIMNEKPIYISYTSSGFGFVGRSVYQRALYPLKSFVQSMVTDDMVTRKAGVLIAKMKPAGSIVNKIMAGATAIKRNLLNEAQTGNTISIMPEESIETLNMQNVDIAMTVARKNILENIAAADDMPARMLTEETLAAGFGEGSEDSKKEAQYIDRMRKWMQPLYEFFDPIIMYRAWSPEFYETIQSQFPDEYGDIDYNTAFFQWRNSFRADWPNLMKEPDSELSKVDKVKLDAVVALVTLLMPMMDPENKGALIQWAADNFNDLKMLFGATLDLDIEALIKYEPPKPELTAQEPSTHEPSTDEPDDSK